jgi:hypothetical protein
MLVILENNNCNRPIELCGPFLKFLADSAGCSIQAVLKYNGSSYPGSVRFGLCYDVHGITKPWV